MKMLQTIARQMVHGAKSLMCLVMSVLISLLSSCTIEPPLHLVDPDKDVDLKFIVTDIDVIWQYELTYDWQAEWYYGMKSASEGWDEKDEEIFGKWELAKPTVFNIRRYYKEENMHAPHTKPLANQINDTVFRAKYKLGYYDLLIWNDVNTIDGIQSLHYDETTTYEYVTAFTNQTNVRTNAPAHAPAYNPNYTPGLAFYQPEFLLAARYDDLHVTDNPDDYDYIIDNVWYKHVPLLLEPVTYIYMPQIALLHNNGKVTQIEGNGNLTGMARSVNLNTHITSTQDISVNHSLRMKKGLRYRDGLTADIIGGRLMTFGLTGCDPYHITRSGNSYAHVQDSKIRNYLEVKMYFNNGTDSTLVFDVTNIVKERYKGGVIPIEIDCDTLRLPNRSGGSGFDAVVKDYEEVQVPEIEL